MSRKYLVAALLIVCVRTLPAATPGAPATFPLKLVVEVDYEHGLTRAMVARAPALAIGGFEIKSPLVYRSLDTSGVEHANFDGNLGAPILREFTCIYDLPHEAIYPERNIWFNKPELDDHSGLVLDTRSAR